ncbi:hypothetical protein QBC35DRAFT_534065 [Podospora australis]|uniref:Uncharacterized protein n=1 Tax=Podospora australis TaxID=1536484 RepID=A0AAN7AH46_9PEZI|nr:hypothetical protein QBC35DRAFT_534065 [Podospora australis]
MDTTKYTMRSTCGVADGQCMTPISGALRTLATLRVPLFKLARSPQPMSRTIHHFCDSKAPTSPSPPLLPLTTPHHASQANARSCFGQGCAHSWKRAADRAAQTKEEKSPGMYTTPARQKVLLDHRAPAAPLAEGELNSSLPPASRRRFGISNYWSRPRRRPRIHYELSVLPYQSGICDVFPANGSRQRVELNNNSTINTVYAKAYMFWDSASFGQLSPFSPCSPSAPPSGDLVPALPDHVGPSSRREVISRFKNSTEEDHKPYLLSWNSFIEAVCCNPPCAIQEDDHPLRRTSFLSSNSLRVGQTSPDQEKHLPLHQPFTPYGQAEEIYLKHDVIVPPQSRLKTSHLAKTMESVHGQGFTFLWHTVHSPPVLSWITAAGHCIRNFEGHLKSPMSFYGIYLTTELVVVWRSSKLAKLPSHHKEVNMGLSTVTWMAWTTIFAFCPFVISPYAPHHLPTL